MAKYVITNGKYYIKKDKRGNFIPIMSPTLADTFTKVKAENILCNQISKCLRSRYHVECIEKDPPGIKSVTKTDLVKTEKIMETDNIMRWIDRIKDLNGLAKDASDRQEQLTQELSKVDKELSDIEHYIEFSNLNAYQGYQAAKMIKDKRRIRRSIKNELTVINVILSRRISETVQDEVVKCINVLDHRTYNPRVLEKMFEL